MTGQSDKAVIRTDCLSRSFGRGPGALRALKGVSFTIDPGEVVALLGVNGAGKTTLIKILSTLLLPTGGSAWIAGHDVVTDAKRARAATSVVFGGDRGLYARLTGRDNLRFFGMLAGLSRRELRSHIGEALERVNLGSAADRRVETYSRGMRQRLHLAIGFLARPRVLLLDEPTVGLDPVESARLRGGITEMRDEGTAILLTSHYLLDVEKLATRVMLLSDGEIRENMTVADFIRMSGQAATVIVTGTGAPPAIAPDRLPEMVVTAAVRSDGDCWEADLRLRHWSDGAFRLLHEMFQAVKVDDVQVRETRLEEAFTAISARLTA